MKRIIVLLAVYFLFAGVALSQSYHGQVELANLPKTGPSHYQTEYDIDVPVNAEA